MQTRASRPADTETRGTGTRPTATMPSTVGEVFVQLIIHVCRKALFYDIKLKIGFYLGSLFLVSMIGDFFPDLYPRTYFASSRNVLNVYFVKMGWAWTLLLSAPLSLMTSYTLCCGNRDRLLRSHVPRILIATAFWFVWTKTFNVIENSYGRCNVRGFGNKSECLKAGHFWRGFDISGHAFILIYSSLVIIEEARPIVGWEYIRDHIRSEEHSRTVGDRLSTNPLRFLKEQDFRKMKALYEKLTPAIRVWFIGCAVLQLLWDVMLVCTMLYYHRMIEKLLSGVIAVSTWYVTYKVWYPTEGTLPDAAGDGAFKYQSLKAPSLKRTSSLLRDGGSGTAAGSSGGSSGGNCSGPCGASRGGTGQRDVQKKFMGMPLYGLNSAASGSGSSNRTPPNGSGAAGIADETVPLATTPKWSASERRNRFPEV